MKELLVISGKGGTGKTSIVGSFAVLADNKVLADCDVDAADLHLLLSPTVRKTNEFRASRQAVLDPARCIGPEECVGPAECVDAGQCSAWAVCAEVCRFEAIGPAGRAGSAARAGLPHIVPRIDPISCEGCGVCARACPHGAISMEEVLSGHWFVSDTAYGPMVHARLGVAQENSGKLVTQVRREARSIAESQSLDYIITDGPPGIGCPVISSMSGVDFALIVTEPTVAGAHDMQRAVELARHFGVKTTVCINKYDLDEAGSEQLEEYCSSQGIQVAGKVPFDEEVVSALVRGVPVVARGSSHHAEGKAAQAIRRLWSSIESELAD
ncbi:MAG TPA: ATP-binding protein [Bacillota bacterium]|jgi:MinD superfamily P-loop ATPase|nr:ATP-binding protein [Bacillota bacterium]